MSKAIWFLGTADIVSWQNNDIIYHLNVHWLHTSALKGRWWRHLGLCLRLGWIHVLNIWQIITLRYYILMNDRNRNRNELRLVTTVKKDFLIVWVNYQAVSLLMLPHWWRLCRQVVHLLWWTQIIIGLILWRWHIVVIVDIVLILDIVDGVVAHIELVLMVMKDLILIHVIDAGYWYLVFIIIIFIHNIIWFPILLAFKINLVV